MHVLVVEDDPAMQELLATLLKGIDSQVHIYRADTVAAGINFWRKHPIGLVLCDLNLPNQESGLTLVKTIREKNAKLPIVMITGSGDRATVKSSLQHRVNEFIVKPFEPASVMERLQRYFDNDKTTPDHAPKSGKSLESFISDVDAVLARLTLLPGAEAALQTLNRDDKPSALDLAQQWQNDSAITTRLIWLANSSLMRRSGHALTTLREAISAVGVDMALSQVLALSLANKNQLRQTKLQALSEIYAKQTQKLAESAALLAKQLKVSVANCYTAGLMVRLGELATLEAIQLYLDSGGEATDEEIESAVQKHAAHYGNRLKIKWRLPIELRERIGATFSTSAGQVQPELLVMRLAACLTMTQEHNSEVETLCRRLGIQPTDLPSR
ncbi:response regulator [Gilvimarinus agarilyticus]|uniref:response regulator n=1 Tax=Gilvimarinus sp. 2_MG-2023 TaxID=3062666 RepID=UPI001C0A0B2C|nr:response regulator [Gilvimarinus sp. 2_MG-2023]MBU2886564.1 response regulator [Gilvimarinus agarilyticus]MDO6571232.1 response regulator [Gilvimarinus sp. 2_MG-2023]